MKSKSITIAGGGLAGLALGIALRNRGVPVVLHEAGRYPRHRVCGEFLSGANAETLQTLRVDDIWKPAVVNISSGWYEGGRPMMARRLPVPALGLSRRHLDAALAERFRNLGGDLREHSRLSSSTDSGTVWATGRKNGGRGWLGLKAHFRHLPMHEDLEMHFGQNAYIGMSRIENEQVNVCGLFARQAAATGPKERILLTYLAASGLSDLTDRIEGAETVSGSLTTVASLDFTSWNAEPGILRIGDSYSAIPPFTGNGMSIALESAAVCIQPIMTYSQNEATWEDTCRESNRRLAKRFSTRLRLARAIHPFLLKPPCRRVLFFMARTRLMPFNLLFHALR